MKKNKKNNTEALDDITPKAISGSTAIYIEKYSRSETGEFFFASDITIDSLDELLDNSLDNSLEKKKKKKSNIYFGPEEEKAVADYIGETDILKRNKIYRTKLKPAFCKMVNALIKRYILYMPNEEVEQTANDALSFLLTKLNNFSPETGKKAYSYCGTVLKHYLIFRRSQYQRKDMNNISFDTAEHPNIIEDPRFITSGENTENIPEIMIKEMLSSVSDMCNSQKIELNENEKKMGASLNNLLEHWEDMFPPEGSNKLLKSSVLYYFRESTNLSTKEVRDAMKKFKQMYYEKKKKLLNDQ